MLSVESIHVGYGRIPVLNGISLSVGDHEVVGILGHNGMGKTTLLKALIGQLPVTQGAIRFAAQDITREPSFRRARAGIGYVPQGRVIFPALTVYENLRMGFVENGVNSEANILRDILARFPRLESLLDRSGGALSGGEQQILALARALCGRPKLLLLDEPTEGIQPSIVDEIVEILQGLHRHQGLAIVVVEQSLDFIRGLSERVLRIEKGIITDEMLPEALEQLSWVSTKRVADAPAQTGGLDGRQ
jgi:branched-chain amino acid transport system ATP-binding protein